MRYPGGKGACFRQVINLLPPHRVYIESHLGGGAVLRHKRPAELSIGVEIDADIIAKWREAAASSIPSLHIIQADATAFLAAYPWRGDELVYADPPYVTSTRAKRRIYAHELDDDGHRRLLRVLLELPCAVVISGYRNRLYEKWLGGWRRVTIPNTTRGGRVLEHAWCNFAPPEVLHDTRYLGASFRERERIQRQRRRWGSRFAKLLPSHQLAMLEHLLDHAAPEVAREYSRRHYRSSDSAMAPAASLDVARIARAAHDENGDARGPRRKQR